MGLNKEARNILAYGTDGEEELYRGLKFSFPYAVHLRCFLHFRENCKAQLKKSNIPEAQQKKFLADIFGRRVGDTWENGMHNFFILGNIYIHQNLVSPNYSTVIRGRLYKTLNHFF